MNEDIKKGLLGIVVDETTISHVVPELSALTYRGYKVQDLCDKCEFEEVAYLVLKCTSYGCDQNMCKFNGFRR